MRIPLPKQYYQTVDIRYKGKKIRTYVFGRGPKKVLSLPAYPHSGLIYLYLLLHYDLDKIQFISFDLPGWIGESESIYNDGVYSEDETVLLIDRIIKHFDLKKFSVIGFSFGTSLAARILQGHEDKIEKLALVSPILKGIDVDNRTLRTTLNFIRRAHAFKIAKIYVIHRFDKYKKYLKESGMDPSIISEYFKMLYKSDAKVLFTSLDHLFSSDYTNCITHFRDKDIMIVNSLDETGYFRKQAGHIRHLLTGEKSIFMHGNHEDFVLKPQDDVVRAVIGFLTK